MLNWEELNFLIVMLLRLCLSLMTPARVFYSSYISYILCVQVFWQYTQKFVYNPQIVHTINGYRDTLFPVFVHFWPYFVPFRSKKTFPLLICVLLVCITTINMTGLNKMRGQPSYRDIPFFPFCPVLPFLPKPRHFLCSNWSSMYETQI